MGLLKKLYQIFKIKKLLIFIFNFLLILLIFNPLYAVENSSCPLPKELKEKKTPSIVIYKQFELFYSLPQKDLKNRLDLLQIILEEEPDNTQAQKEMGYLQIKLRKYSEAYKCFTYALKKYPNNTQIINQLKYLKNTIKNQYNNLNKNNKSYLSKKSTISKQDYYVNAAYAELAKKNYQQALSYLEQAKKIDNNDAQINMQYAYILDSLNRKREAYWQFASLADSQNSQFSLKANQAMSNLSGLQTKLLPNSWFIDFYFAPIYFSRFDLFVYPFQFRIGKKLGNKKQAEIYLGNRTTWDSKSGAESAPFLPEIYSDNVSIFSIGARYSLINNAYGHLQTFAELGKAYNLILSSDKKRWEDDFRTGLIYYNSWGSKIAYADKPEFIFKPVGSLYSDLTYFSRYQGNIIGFFSLKEGIRVFQYHVSDLDIYLRLRSGLDKNKDFYNNFIEVGPGIDIIPNHRYNFAMRYEYLKGFYVKRQALDFNPYGPTYNNNLILAEFYMEI